MTYTPEYLNQYKFGTLVTFLIRRDLLDRFHRNYSPDQIAVEVMGKLVALGLRNEFLEFMKDLLQVSNLLCEHPDDQFRLLQRTARQIIIAALCVTSAREVATP